MSPHSSQLLFAAPYSFNHFRNVGRQAVPLSMQFPPTAMTTGCLLSSFRAEQPAAMGVYVILSIDTQSREISRADGAQWEMRRYPSQRAEAQRLKSDIYPLSSHH